MRDTEQLLVKARKPSEDALRLHPYYKGKIQVLPKCPVRSFSDFAVWYTPGVAAPCQAIRQTPELVYEHTNKGNSIAVVSDGSRVLGLGNIGPEAGLPVMEGKALLFKYLGGVDAVPICLSTRSPDDIVQAVRYIQPSFGAVNLEDIAQPQCFRVLDELRDGLEIPVWHDDQQGTAIVLLAALVNALKVVGKGIDDVRIVMMGVGAANVAVYRLLRAYGLEPGAIVACDSAGTLHKGRRDIEERRDEYFDKWRICNETNAESIVGDPAGAFEGADVCIAFSRSGPDVIQPAWIRAMARDAVVFACANPIPEIWPWDAAEAGARIVATGRSDFPNQLNNSLGFPGVFRGVLDVRARTISDGMAFAAARALAGFAERSGISDDRILPSMAEWEVAAEVAAATGLQAQEEGLARKSATFEQLRANAVEVIRLARESTELLAHEKLIAPPPVRPEPTW